MDRNARRLQGFLKQYQNSDMKNIRLQRLVGIDARARWQEIWRTVDAAARIFLASKDSRRRHEQLPSRGAVGCYLSHLAAYRSVQTHGDVVMILEDDADIPRDLKKRAERTLSAVPDDWDIILMRYRTPGWNLSYPVSPRQLQSFVGLQTYMISSRGANKILSDRDTFPIDRQIDGHISALAKRGKLNVYGAGRGSRMSQPGLLAGLFTTVQSNALTDPFLSWQSSDPSASSKYIPRQVFDRLKTSLYNI